MATGTHPDHFIVINVSGRHRGPWGRSGLVAGIAHIRGSNVVGIFS